jgi:hypothetical protein
MAPGAPGGSPARPDWRRRNRIEKKNGPDRSVRKGTVYDARSLR